MESEQRYKRCCYKPIFRITKFDIDTNGVPIEYKRCIGEFPFHRCICSLRSANSTMVESFIRFGFGAVTCAGCHSVRIGLVVGLQSIFPLHSSIGIHVRAYRLQIPLPPCLVTYIRFAASNSLRTLFSVRGDLKPCCFFITDHAAVRLPLLVPVN